MGRRKHNIYQIWFRTHAPAPSVAFPSCSVSCSMCIFVAMIPLSDGFSSSEYNAGCGAPELDSGWTECGDERGWASGDACIGFAQLLPPPAAEANTWFLVTCYFLPFDDYSASYAYFPIISRDLNLDAARASLNPAILSTMEQKC